MKGLERLLMGALAEIGPKQRGDDLAALAIVHHHYKPANPGRLAVVKWS